MHHAWPPATKTMAESQALGHGGTLDRDSLLVDAGLDLGLSAKHTLGVGLTGEIGTDSRNHGVTGQWRMSF